MYNRFTIARKYLYYCLTASSGKGHGIHSPFVFDFITGVLNDRRHFYAYEKVEALRAKLKLDQTTITVNDQGAGSAAGGGGHRKIADIARTAAKSQRYGQLLFRIANHYRPATILEMGTSLGLSAAYLAMGNASARTITIEGSEAIAGIARKNLASLGLLQVQLEEGNFDDALPVVLQTISGPVLVFVDGNHAKAPTLRYFEQLLEKIDGQSIIIFDDIHWSAEMEEAWNEIKLHPKVMLSIDLFFIGLVFFRTDFKVKQHFTLRF